MPSFRAPTVQLARSALIIVPCMSVCHVIIPFFEDLIHFHCNAITSDSINCRQAVQNKMSMILF